MENAIAKRNVILKDRHHGRRCFIIGNGPSLDQHDLSLLSNELTFVASGFYNHPIVDQWQPSYYFFADPAFFKYIDKQQDWRDFFDLLKSRISDSDYVVPYAAYDVIKDHGLLPLQRTHFVRFRNPLWNSWIVDLDMTRAIPAVMNVVEFCIMSAIYMGCKEIYLLGLDHDFLTHRGEERHFYKGLGGMGKCEAEPSDRSLQSYKLHMSCVLKLWEGYERLLAFANKKKVRILNASRGGFLDIFERASYDRLFANPDFSDKTSEISKDDFKIIATRVLDQFYKRADPPGAIYAAMQAINRYPDNLHLRMLEVQVRTQAGDKEGAKIGISELMRKYPELSWSYLILSEILFEEGKINDALTYIQKAYQLSPSDSKTVDLLGKILSTSGQTDQACNLYSQHLRQHPDDIEIKKRLAKLKSPHLNTHLA